MSTSQPAQSALQTKIYNMHVYQSRTKHFINEIVLNCSQQDSIQWGKKNHFPSTFNVHAPPLHTCTHTHTHTTPHTHMHAHAHTPDRWKMCVRHREKSAFQTGDFLDLFLKRIAMLAESSRPQQPEREKIFSLQMLGLFLEFSGVFHCWTKEFGWVDRFEAVRKHSKCLKANVSIL